MKRKLKGFTLVELVITIAIVIILSVISVPIYQGYTRKAKMAEGYALLGQILSAQKNYYSEYGNFLMDDHAGCREANYTQNEVVLGIDARGNRYFRDFNVNWIGLTSDSKLFTHPRVKIPTELRTGDKSLLALYYDLTVPDAVRFLEL